MVMGTKDSPHSEYTLHEFECIPSILGLGEGRGLWAGSPVDVVGRSWVGLVGAGGESGGDDPVICSYQCTFMLLFMQL